MAEVAEELYQPDRTPRGGFGILPLFAVHTDMPRAR